MFSNSIQPSVVSLFSSTGTDPLQLFKTHLDASLAADSSIHLLHDTKCLPLPVAPAVLISPPSMNSDDSDDVGYGLNQTVLQIQSPTLQTTYIHCPPIDGPGYLGRSFRSTRDKSNDLGFRHPWMHIQVRNMGREWSFEVGIVDQSNRMGIIRFSTFQKQLRLKLSATIDSYPLLHVPLSFPASSSRPLTAWSTIALSLPSYLPYFSSSSLINQGDGSVDDDSNIRSLRTNSAGAIPGGSYSHVAYVRIYATCRLRRIWFDEAGPGQKIPWEFELYGNE